MGNHVRWHIYFTTKLYHFADLSNNQHMLFVPLNMIGELCTLSSRYNSLVKFEFKLNIYISKYISKGAQIDTSQIKAS